MPFIAKGMACGFITLYSMPETCGPGQANDDGGRAGRGGHGPAAEGGAMVPLYSSRPSVKYFGSLPRIHRRDAAMSGRQGMRGKGKRREGLIPIDIVNDGLEMNHF